MLKDFINYWKHRKEIKFSGFGIRVFVGPFGAGKTSSLIQYAYKQACKYPGLNILTIMEIKNFPKSTNIQKLTSWKQVINAPDHTLVLLDEFSSLFPASDWHKGLPISFRAMILHLRKKNILIVGTAQEFCDLYVFFRRHTYCVYECKCNSGRWNSVDIYDGKDYENSMAPTRYGHYSFIQTDKIRNLYNTRELIKPVSMTDVEEHDKEYKDAIEAELNNLNNYHGKVTTKKKRGRPKKSTKNKNSSDIV